jgi:hypothetical protein
MTKALLQLSSMIPDTPENQVSLNNIGLSYLHQVLAAQVELMAPDPLDPEHCYHNACGRGRIWAPSFNSHWKHWPAEIESNNG